MKTDHRGLRSALGPIPATSRSGRIRLRLTMAPIATAPSARADRPPLPFGRRFMQKLALAAIMVLIIGPFLAWPLTALIIYKNPFWGVGRSFM